MLILTANEILVSGLCVGGFDECQLTGVQRSENVERFKSIYGSDPQVYANIWEDLQMTTIADARVDNANESDLKSYFMALSFFQLYEKERVREAKYKLCSTTIRNRTWDWVRRIQALKEEKVCSSSRFFINPCLSRC